MGCGSGEGRDIGASTSTVARTRGRGSERARTVEQERDGPAIDEADVHHGAEDTLAHLETGRGHPADEVTVEAVGLLGRGRRGIAGPAAAARVAIEREL